MNILHVSPMYYPVIGGHAVHMKELSEKMAAISGERITVFTTLASKESELRHKDPAMPEMSSLENMNGVTVKRFKINYLLHDLLFTKLDRIRGGSYLRKYVFSEAVCNLRAGPIVFKMVWDIIRLKPDIVLSLNSGYANIYFCYLARKVRKFTFVIIPSLYMDDPTKESACPMLDRFCLIADAIIALTEYERKVLIQKGCKPEKITVIGCGVNLEQFKQANGMRIRTKFGLKNEPVIGFLGRRCKAKGIELLIRAMPLVWESIPTANIIIAGIVDDKFRLLEQRLISSFDETEKKKIIFIDEFSQEEKPDIFDSFDVFAMPAIGESFGIVYLEAWACRKPVIAVRDSVPASFINDGKEGLLVEHGNVQV